MALRAFAAERDARMRGAVRSPRTSLTVAMVWLLAMLVPLPSAGAATCPGPGGTAVTRSTDQTGDFVVIGGGFGHGAGMSQYGARGAALLGCTWPEILAAYYPGTTRGSSVPTGMNAIRVSIIPSTATADLPAAVSIEAVSDRIPWRRGDTTRYQSAGVTWRASVDSQGRYTIRRGTTTIFPAAGGSIRVGLRGKVVRLPAKNHRYNRGVLLLSWSGQGANTFVTDAIGSIDRYLYGLAEMPSSWPQAALRAQATAGRTYALAKREARDTASTKWQDCRCDVYDSVSDQAYSAYDWESVAPAWTAAVDATSGRTLRYGGATATALYHSSSGGYVDSAQYVFNEPLPYSTALNDSRWERASANPNTTWVEVFTAEQLGAAFGVGTATEVRTPPPKSASGRVGDPDFGAGGVVIVGTQGETTVSGPDFRFRLGLKSALFRVLER